VEKDVTAVDDDTMKIAGALACDEETFFCLFSLCDSEMKNIEDIRSRNEGLRGDRAWRAAGHPKIWPAGEFGRIASLFLCQSIVIEA